MNLNFLFKILIVTLYASLWVTNIAKAIDSSVLDPLNLKQQKNTEEVHNYNLYPLSTITSITSDSVAKALVITAIPNVNSSYSISGRTVEIVLKNSFLHKNLANQAYDWDHKLKNQLYNLVSVVITKNTRLKKVTILLKFSTDISIQEVKVKKSVINYIFMPIKQTR